MKKILFLVSLNAFFRHHSGEVELKLLQIGFKLAGYQCDIVGIDSEDFNKYDIYIMFSLYDDLDVFIREIDDNKTLVVYPQTEQYTDVTSEKIRKFLSYVPKSFVVARNSVEVDFYSSAVSPEKILRVPGWFVEPFIWSKSTEAIDLTCDYALAFSSNVDTDRFVNIYRYCVENNLKFYLVSSQIKYELMPYDDFFCYPKVTYGSEIWFRLLKNCIFFYELNDRVTNSVLEAISMGKPVVSEHAEVINNHLGFAGVAKPSEVFPELTPADKKQLLGFSVETVANNLIRKLEEYDVCKR